MSSAAGWRRKGRRHRAARQIYLLQRKTSKVGEGLGKTTGWIHRASLAMRGVKMLNSVSYRLIDDEGLHITRAEQDSCLPVDTVVICAGQEPRRELQQPLLAMGKTVHLIGGADVAAELDARRAIDQGTRLAMALKRAHSAPWSSRSATRAGFHRSQDHELLVRGYQRAVAEQTLELLVIVEVAVADDA